MERKFTTADTAGEWAILDKSVLEVGKNFNHTINTHVEDSTTTQHLSARERRAMVAVRYDRAQNGAAEYIKAYSHRREQFLATTP